LIDTFIETLTFLNRFQILVESLENETESKEKIESLKVVVTGLSIDKVSDFFKYTFGIVPHVPHNVQSNENGTVTVTLASQNDLETVLKLSTQLPQVR
jgi:UDP-N-acetylglucosamine 2-epimerase